MIPPPIAPATPDDIENLLSTPTPGAISSAQRLDGDFIVLGVAGKMGVTLALMLRRALDQAGRKDAIITGVSRFSRAEARAELESKNVRTIACDLAEPDQVAKLPRTRNVLYLAGQKFGTDGSPGTTWMQNTFVPALIARQFRDSRIVVFSTGCVYPFAPVPGRGCAESEPVAFLGDYASSCIGRERVFSHYAEQYGTKQLIYRLNYAVELRYGVLVDIATKVHDGEPVDVTMGHLNFIWQGDACARAIQCLEHVSNPPKILNITGEEKFSVRALAEEFGRIYGRKPVLTGREADTAWLADASESVRLFGPALMKPDEIIARTAAHVAHGGRTLGKPTHFETRSGKF